MASQENSLVAKAIEVKTVRTDELQPNQHNPRMLFDRLPLKVLEESIEKVGILVPLTVYKEKKSGKYIILDGQRRWICAQNLKLNTVPVNEVAEPTLVQNIVTMFQIHKLREDWELMPTALKVEVLMNELKEKGEKKLSQLTGLDEAVIVRCKKLLYYDRDIQDMMLDPNPDKRIKADFFIELYSVIKDREVLKFRWFKEKKFIRQMLDKYLKDPRTIKAVTDFRLIKQYISTANKANVIKRMSTKLKEFAEDRNLPIQHLEISEVSKHAGVNALMKKISAVQSSIEELDTELYYGEEKLWDAVSKLIKALQEKLKKANRR